MKLMVADGQRLAKEAAARGEQVAIWGPSPGFRELRWLKPVLAGDTISFATEVESVRSSEKRPPTSAASWCTRCWRPPSCRAGTAVQAERRNPREIPAIGRAETILKQIWNRFPLTQFEPCAVHS